MNACLWYSAVMNVCMGNSAVMTEYMGHTAMMNICMGHSVVIIMHREHYCDECLGYTAIINAWGTVL